MAKFSTIRRALLAALAVTAAALQPGLSRAETTTVRLAQQFGVASLPLMVMQHQNLIEKHAKAEGVDLKAEWMRFSGGAMMNDALLSGSLDMATAGVTPLLTIWDKTKTSLQVKGLASLGQVPFVLVSTNPDFKSITDISKTDRIAVPAVKVSIQAVVLQRAAAKAFGLDKASSVNAFTVSMKHSDAAVAMLGGGTEINGHISSSPYYELELEKAKGAHKVFSSTEVVGPSTNVALYTTTKFHDANPKTVKIVLAALEEAMDFIAKNHDETVKIYKAVTKEKYDDAFLLKAFFGGENIFNTTPKGFMGFAEFMHSQGTLTNLPTSWKDVFFAEAHGKDGN